MYYCIFVVDISVRSLEEDQVSAFKNKYPVGQDIISTANSLRFLTISIVPNLKYIIVSLLLLFQCTIWKKIRFQLLRINIELVKM